MGALLSKWGPPEPGGAPIGKRGPPVRQRGPQVGRGPGRSPGATWGPMMQVGVSWWEEGPSQIDTAPHDARPAVRNDILHDILPPKYEMDRSGTEITRLGRKHVVDIQKHVLKCFFD